MFCDKCGGNVNSNGKCSLCGYDNFSYTSEKYAVQPDSIRSVRLTIFMCIVVVLDLIIAVGSLMTLFSNHRISTSSTVILVLTIILCVIEVIVAFFIFRLRAWARNTYIVLSVIAGIMKLIRLDFFYIIFRALLLYFIFKKDWDNFE